MFRKWIWLAASLACLFAPTWAAAQGSMGAITGVVTDTTGAVVPNAKIIVTGTNTGVSSTINSSSAGYYRLPVPPGTYRVEATKQGFKTGVVDQVIVPVAQVVTENFTLQVGTERQSVTVTSTAPLLTPDTAEVGTSMSPKEFATLPIAVDCGGRQLQSFIFQSLPGATGDAFAGSISGGQLFSSEIMIDGISIARYDLSGGSLTEFSPSADAVSEFTVQQTQYSAEYGDTGGGVQNFVLKSGTNQFHGSVYEYLRNPAFSAAGFSNNASGGQKAQTRDNNFGFTVGGPIKKDRTFFFFNYEGDRYRNFNFGGRVTLPTPAMRGGDFSSWLTQDPNLANLTDVNGNACSVGNLCQVGTDALGRPVYENEIYNPLTTRTVNGQIVRDPFPNNVIPPEDFSTASMALAKLFPDPEFNSLIRNTPKLAGNIPILNVNRWTLKIDHAISDTKKISASFTNSKRDRFNRNASSFPPFPGFPLNPVKRQITGGPQARFTYNWTVSNHAVNTFELGYNRFYNTNNITPDATFATDLGIPGVLPVCFPPIKFSGHVGQLGTFGVGCSNSDPSSSYLMSDTLAYLHGKHSLKFGGDFRRYNYNTFEPGSQGGTFSFSDRETALPGFTDDTGEQFASFLLGAVDSGSRSVYNTEPGYRAGVLSFFVQDDWKATRKLTLNIGLRYELPLPKKEAFNRMSGLNPNLPNPGADNIPGALEFLGSCNGCNGRDSFQNMYWKEFAPRFGLAYQVTNNLVFRGGYGISYGPPILNNFGSQTIFGYNSSVPLPRGTSGTGFNLDPVTYWTQLNGAALPAGAQVGVPAFTGTLPTIDPSFANGNGIDFLPKGSLAQPYTQNWSAGFQYMLPKDTLLEAEYVGSKGTRLLQSMFSNMFNQVPSKYIGLGDILGDDLATDLADPVTGPILASYGITGLPYPSFETTNFNPTVAQSLRPFPQYDPVTNDYPTMGSSTYHSLQVKLQKRTAQGLNFIAAYTYSKTLTNADTALYYPTGGFGIYNFGQDFYNRAAEKSIASFDRPQSLKLTWSYDLPIGHGQHFLGGTHGVVDKLVSGWTITAIQNYQSGDPLAITTEQCTGIYNGPYGDGCGVRPTEIGGVPQTLSHSGLDAENGTPFLNPAAFLTPALTTNNGYAETLGNTPRLLPKLRGPFLPSEDFGIRKTIHISERYSFDVRADAFNVFNRVGLGDPDTDVDSGTFGLVFNPQQGGRVIQMSARFNF